MYHARYHLVLLAASCGSLSFLKFTNGISEVACGSTKSDCGSFEFFRRFHKTSVQNVHVRGPQKKQTQDNKHDL